MKSNLIGTTVLYPIFGEPEECLIVDIEKHTIFNDERLFYRLQSYKGITLLIRGDIFFRESVSMDNI